jgi:NADH-quinone oxidoreductase subunit N
MDSAAILSELRYLAPEIATLVVAAAAMFVHLFFPRRGHRLAGYVAFAGIAAVCGVLLLTPQSAGAIMAGTLIADRFAVFLKLVALISALLAIALSFRFFDVEGGEPGEIYYLLPLSLVGIMAAVSSADLITTYVAFEVFAIPSYVLAGVFKKERRSGEAGVKYFFLGSLSSALMLLGMALVFGLTGETSYAVISRSLRDINTHLALTGMILFFSGLFFKAALVPFHQWAPDVYEGAPTPLVVFLSTAPKAAVFALLIRSMITIFAGFRADWSLIFQGIALVTMFWGNLAALIQTNIKRMMAYSAIAQAGYIVIGLAAWGELAQTAVLFYIFIYVFMNAAAFGLILLVRKGETFGETIDDMRGLARRSPGAAAAILIVLLSLTGIPPTAGFIGKYFLFASAVEKGMYLVVVAGALNSVISLFYYFRIGRAMFMEDPAAGEAPAAAARRSAWAEIVIGVSAVIILLWGIFPSLLSDFAASSVLVRF